MKVKIEGTDGYVYEFSPAPDDLTNLESMEVKKVAGLNHSAIGAALAEGDPVAWTALAYVSRRRVEPEVRFKDVSFRMGDMEFVDDEADVDPTEAATTEPD